MGDELLHQPSAGRASTVKLRGRLILPPAAAGAGGAGPRPARRGAGQAFHDTSGSPLAREASPRSEGQCTPARPSSEGDASCRQRRQAPAEPGRARLVVAPARRVMGERGFEPLKAEPTGLQPVPFGHSGTPPRPGHCSASAKRPRALAGPLSACILRLGLAGCCLAALAARGLLLRGRAALLRVRARGRARA